MDSHLNYSYLKISIKIVYHPQTFLYLILYLRQWSGAFPICRYSLVRCPPPRQTDGVSVARCGQRVGSRGGLCEETRGCPLPDTASSSQLCNGPTTGKILKKGQKNTRWREEEGEKSEKQQHESSR